jgi:diguanylate cyclase (GGDEF)-like protein/PAS domain S-box-containing protein
MDSESVSVLLVDDDPQSVSRIRAALSGTGPSRFRIRQARSVRLAQQRLARKGTDVLLLNLSRSGMQPLGALALLQAQAPRVPVLVLASKEEEHLALKAVKQGAHDYLLTEQIYRTVLIRALRHAVEQREANARSAAAERALRESEARYRALFEQSRDAIVLADAAGRITNVNRATAELLGYRALDLGGRPLASLQFEPAVPEELELAELRASWEFETRLRRRGGDYVWCLLSAAAQRDEAGTIIGYQAIIHDITERKLAEDRLMHSALHDALTGLPNRALLADRLDMAFARMRRYHEQGFAVLFLDLDRFKVVNDSLGHAIGDKLLLRVAEVLKSCVRDEDTVARMGGDEFAILLNGVHDEEGARATVLRIQEQLAQPFALDGHSLFTSASIGMAFPASPEQTAADLLRNADMAMYRAKAAGPARYRVFLTDMHTRAADLLRLETDLRLAVARNEFELHYQPIIGLDNDDVIGMEALIRWHHPERGLLAPADFIDLAEETGLIVPMGWWALRQACRQAKLWSSLCHDVCPTMNVNLSSRQIMVPDLVEQVEAILTETGLPGASLALEITEHTLMSDTAVTASSLVRLRALGIQLTLDDFGTGYSSLGYLHALPIDGLKIDRSFVHALGSVDDRAGLVGTIISLARRLDITAVAEGVETEAQLTELRRLGSEYVQGFLFSRPVAAHEATAFIAQRFGARSRHTRGRPLQP